MKRALFSVYRKDGIDSFAKFLAENGYEIIATGGTFRYLKGIGVDVKEVSSATGFPEVLNGRVKTLHPVVNAGILAVRDNQKHIEELEKLNISLVDFVVVNLYPFEETINKPGVKFDEIIEQIDIGGVTLIRAAAKNFSGVTVVVDNNDFDNVRNEIEEKGATSDETRRNLAAKAFSHTAYYDSLISSYFNNLTGRKFPAEYSIPLKSSGVLRYGENPHQKANLYSSFNGKNISSVNAEILWGKEMSYNNYLDADACIDILREFTEKNKPFCTIIKHTNPCGASLGGTLIEAFDKARACDPDAAFGGIVGFNGKIDIGVAGKINETFFEIVIAKEIDEEALKLLKKKKNIRILKLCGDCWEKSGLNYRRIEGGFLSQDWDVEGPENPKWEVKTKRKPNDAELENWKFAWKLCKHVKSNAIVYVKNLQAIGVGAGQMSRIDSARIGVLKAQDKGFDLKGSVLASDAFFPFRDTVDNAAKSGVAAIVQPGGSLRDEESIKAAEENNISMIFTGMRHFRH